MKFEKISMLHSVVTALALLLVQVVPHVHAEKKVSHTKGILVGAGGHNAEGSVTLNVHTLTLSDIKIDDVPDGRVYLTKNAEYESGVELGKLTQFSGTVKYTIPSNVDPSDYNSVLIWCKKFSVEIGHAQLAGPLPPR